MSFCWIKRVALGVFALLFFGIAGAEVRSSGLSSQSAFAGVIGILFTVGCITAKGG